MGKNVFLFFIFYGSFFLVGCGGASSESLRGPHSSEGEVAIDTGDPEDEVINVVEIQNPDTNGRRVGLNLSNTEPDVEEGPAFIVEVDQQSGVEINDERILETGQKVTIGVDQGNRSDRGGI